MTKVDSVTVAGTAAQVSKSEPASRIGVGTEVLREAVQSQSLNQKESETINDLKMTKTMHYAFRDTDKSLYVVTRDFDGSGHKFNGFKIDKDGKKSEIGATQVRNDRAVGNTVHATTLTIDRKEFKINHDQKTISSKEGSEATIYEFTPAASRSSNFRN